jgi:leucine dehydrogenase
MSLFAHPEFDGHEKVLFGCDAESGLKAIVAIHNSSRGPALGGCRFWSYADEGEAVTDVLRLARGMTYKSALADLPFGGGKSVIIGDPKQLKSEALLRAMGRLVDSLGGAYVVAEDVGISVEDVEIIAQETAHVAGTRAAGAGDPSPATAYGTFVGLKAAVAHKFGRKDLSGLRVAVQGLGHVGFALCHLLHEAGAKLVVADIDAERTRHAVEAFGASAADPAGIVAAEVEVYAPCALGAVINDRSLAQLKARIVAGSANNQLAEPRHGDALRERGVLYAPDYVINAGGIINISHESGRGQGAYDRPRAFAHVARIGETLAEIFRHAEQHGIATSNAADRIAEKRFKTRAAKAA